MVLPSDVWRKPIVDRNGFHETVTLRASDIASEDTITVSRSPAWFNMNEAGIGRVAQSTVSCSSWHHLGAFRMVPPSPNIAITYCRLCNWMLRAAWMGQEFLSTFAEEAGSLTLIPDDTGGVFEVRIDGTLVWSRSEQGRFPEITELKQIVRDRIAPAHGLGHADRKS
ncbi:SelT/SelW/SelH family protein [Methyloceanibacter sp.]|uniref:SelT/SelW/SelH family protein n=2 Tax=Methyloceanibacter sp. TaxID=1965321 RepID=UPI003C782D90